MINEHKRIEPYVNDGEMAIKITKKSYDETTCIFKFVID
jgi:hypothetical protein